VTFFLRLSLTLSSSGLHITQEQGTFPSRLSCEDYLEDLALHLRLPADTKVRLECKRAPSVRFNPTHKAEGRGSRFGECLEIHRVSVDAAAHHVGSDWSLALLRSLDDDQPRAAAVSLSGPLG